MSKDLEREYRALADSEVPDLWTRIEAGLDDKKSSDTGNFDENNIVRKKVIPVKVWATVAAACICAGLIVPIMKSHMGGMKEMRSDTASPADYTANNAPAYEMDQEAAAEDMLSDSMDNGVLNSASDSANVKTNNAVTAEGAAYDGGDEVAEAAAEQINTFRTEVEIIDADVRMDSKIMYTAKVLSCENPDLQEDSEITIMVSALPGEDTVLEKGGTYELILCEDNSGEEPVYNIMN